jgi:hypothetical protein
MSSTEKERVLLPEKYSPSMLEIVVKDTAFGIRKTGFIIYYLRVMGGFYK